MFLIEEMNIDFEMKPVDLKFCTIREILFKHKIYDRVSFIAMIQDISEAQEKNTVNGVLKLRNAVVIDDDDEISITFFGKSADDLVEGSSYKITYLCF